MEAGYLIISIFKFINDQYQMSAKLYKLCKKGDRRSQKAVYGQMFGKLSVISKRYIKDGEEAMHVLNTAFLKIFENYGKCHDPDKFEAWASRVVVNTALDHIRASKKYKNKMHFDEGFTYKYDKETDVEEELDNDIKMEEIYGMINELPPTTKMVFNLYAIDGFAHKDIAKKLNMSTGTSKWHLNKARQMLKPKIVKRKQELING